MAIFDIDEYMQWIEQNENIQKIKLYPVQIDRNDMERVTAKTSIIQIKLYIKDLVDKTIEWDLQDRKLRPINVATEIANELNLKDESRKEEIIKELENIIWVEIMDFVDNTLFQEENFAKRRKVTTSTIAWPNWDSLIKQDEEIWKQCEFILKKKILPTKWKSIASFNSMTISTARQNKINRNKLEKISKTRSNFHKTKEYLSDNRYWSYFWSIIVKDPLLISLEGLEDMIKEEDASCLRSLYTRLKEIFCNNPETVFGIDDNQVKEIHMMLDKTYNDMLTDTPLMRDIFKKAQNKNSFYDESISWENVIEEQPSQEQPVFRYRPYNMESKSFYNIVHNSSILSNINSETWQAEDIQDLVKENERLANYLAEKYNSIPNKKGRPKRHEYISEGIFAINSVNDLVPILQSQNESRENGFNERIAIKKIGSQPSGKLKKAVIRNIDE